MNNSRRVLLKSGASLGLAMGGIFGAIDPEADRPSAEYSTTYVGRYAKPRGAHHHDR